MWVVSARLLVGQGRKEVDKGDQWSGAAESLFRPESAGRADGQERKFPCERTCDEGPAPQIRPCHCRRLSLIRGAEALMAPRRREEVLTEA